METARAIYDFAHRHNRPTVAMMTPTAPPVCCPCSLPWAVAAVAALIAVLIAIFALVLPAQKNVSATLPQDLPTSQATAPVVDDHRASAQDDLAEAQRVLNLAQSALAERDREIAAANDELRTLRQALVECRAKISEIPAQAP